MMVSLFSKILAVHRVKGLKKEFQKEFEKHDLEIVVQCNLKIVDYLDVTLNLNNATYKPYRKPDAETNYVHVESNHPPSILKQIPKAIEKRISNLSSNEQIFNDAAPYYADALQWSGYNYQLNYQQSNPNPRNKQRKRKVIWFKSLYDRNVSTSIGKFFLNLIKKHFPKNHKFNKLFNKNTVKISYSCMPSVKSIINAHNKKILHPPPVENDNEQSCNCMVRENCPLENNCLAANIIYEGTIHSDNQPNKKYIGLCEPTFKKRYGGHKSSLTNPKYKHQTSLSTEYWRLKEMNKNPRITWKIVEKSKAFTPESKKCHLCLAEKYHIANFENHEALVNKKSEIVSKCRHRRKFELSLFDSAD